MSNPEDAELRTFRAFDDETLIGRLNMTRSAMRTIFDRSAPKNGIPDSMRQQLRRLVSIASDRGLLGGRKK